MMLNVTSLSYKTTFNRKLLGKLGHTHHPFCADEIQLQGSLLFLVQMLLLDKAVFLLCNCLGRHAGSMWLVCGPGFRFLSLQKQYSLQDLERLYHSKPSDMEWLIHLTFKRSFQILSIFMSHIQHPFSKPSALNLRTSKSHRLQKNFENSPNTTSCLQAMLHFSCDRKLSQF